MGSEGEYANATEPALQARIAGMAMRDIRRGMLKNVMMALPIANPPPIAPVMIPKPRPPLSKTLMAYSGISGNTATPKRFATTSIARSQGIG